MASAPCPVRNWACVRTGQTDKRRRASSHTCYSHQSALVPTTGTFYASTLWVSRMHRRLGPGSEVDTGWTDHGHWPEQTIDDRDARGVDTFLRPV
ncbi:hypothetical protein RIB2604_02001150 [Aspergillus luchuensis]|uniref:Uncharacterized protein n=1 Tax=Aspergillus kawachii TaxID=1069201 RepID=A0A146FIF7_ASPKA|nr:hypothetical protein RIB2604_02001150 [Aspergillus luchuensis]